MAEHAVEVQQSGTAATAGGFLSTLTGGLNTFLNFRLTQQQLSADQRQQTGQSFEVANEPSEKPFSFLGLKAGEIAALVAAAAVVAFGIVKLTDK